MRVANSSGATLPINVGTLASFDYGRVWLPGEDSNAWQQSYGGWLWLALMGALTFSAGLFFPYEKAEKSP